MAVAVPVASFGFAVVVVDLQLYYFPYAVLGHLVHVMMDHELSNSNEQINKISCEILIKEYMSSSNFFYFTYLNIDDMVPVRVAVDSFCDLVSVATFAVFVAAAKENKQRRRKPQNKY